MPERQARYGVPEEMQPLDGAAGPGPVEAAEEQRPPLRLPHQSRPAWGLRRSDPVHGPRGGRQLRYRTRVLASAPIVAKGFSQDQLKKLVRQVDGARIHARDFDGKRLTYIEGWYAIAQANAIFGYAGWDREMVHFERVMEKTRSDATVICGYMARVRIRVRGHSSTQSSARAPAGAQRLPQLRLLPMNAPSNPPRPMPPSGLYRPSVPALALASMTRIMSAPTRDPPSPSSPDGQADSLSAEGYCSGLRQLIEICRTPYEVDQLSRHNRASLCDLGVYVPSLRNSQGVHFADLLLRLMQRRRERVSAGSMLNNSTENAGSGQMSAMRAWGYRC